MLNPCERMIDKILNLITGDLSSHEKNVVQKHIDECSDCQNYLEKLEHDDSMLNEFAAFSESAILRIEENVISEIDNIKVDNEFSLDSIFSKISSSGNLYRYAAAAVILIIVGLLLIFAVSERNYDPDREYVKSKTEKTITEKIEDAESEEIKSEYRLILELAKSGNVEGLTGILENGSMEAKLLAAKLLGEIGAEEAIDALRKLSDQSGEKDNAFERAIKQIKSKDRIFDSGDINDVNLLNVESDANSVVYLSGYILDDHTGEGIDEATIHLYGPVNVNARTDANGFYDFKGQPVEGLYRVRVSAPGYLSSFADGLRKSIEIFEDKAVSKDYMLLKGCMIDLEVVDSNEAPIEDAKVSVYENFGVNGRRQSVIRATDANGFVLLGALKPSNKPYSILVTDDRYAPAVKDITVNDVNFIEYTKIEMQDGLQVAGYVYYNDGMPAVDVKLSAQPVDFPRDLLMNVVDVDANGFFEFNSIKPGKYKISTLNMINFKRMEIADINLPVEEELLEVILPMDSPGKFSILKGTVNYSRKFETVGSDPGTIYVEAISHSGKNYSTAIPAGENEFKLKLPDEGFSMISFKGEKIETKIIEQVAGGLNELEVILDIKANAVIQGKVIDGETGNPVKEFMVRITNEGVKKVEKFNRERKWFEFDNAEGKFKLEISQKQIFSVEIRAKGYGPVVLENLKPGGNIEILAELVSKK